ncbi:RhuM family protein [Pasteurella atlantica]|uniref:RhuM family protein n=2 Tax=Pasteurellaceae TaxID=712 RepID=A0ACC6HK61_9PAST|nr:RhuM family protein [Pasteurella atlantica]MDP8033055.1 RhuM family protein [Pasteurella atlantica]MDP8034992.1 RhuM family protein [Pasteurella atlantica]MDP8037048.1 RhuM family protein [Pasteurella atlantica]MDP8047426.1 RhuM family protein [Pasteurella atlantica]MDP8049095.1 RhuM family protein [Pasteurella atlantica]
MSGRAHKFPYAIHGQTVADLIYKKADTNKEFMGLQTWKNADLQIFD